MTEDRADSRLFLTLGDQCLSAGLNVRFRAHGNSMQPAICDGDMLHVAPSPADKLRKGDIVLFTDGNNVRAHRLVFADRCHDVYVTRGDAGEQSDPAIQSRHMIGKVLAKEEVSNNRLRLVPLCGPRAGARLFGWKARRIASRFVKRGTGRSVILPFLLLLLGASAMFAQVAVDSTTSASSRITGTAPTLTFAHTTAGANRLLVVGVSINLTNSATTTV